MEESYYLSGDRGGCVGLCSPFTDTPAMAPPAPSGGKRKSLVCWLSHFFAALTVVPTPTKQQFEKLLSFLPG